MTDNSTFAPRSQKLMTTDEVSEYLGLGICTVRSLISTGKLKAVRFGRVYRVEPQTLQTFIRQREGIR